MTLPRPARARRPRAAALILVGLAALGLVAIAPAAEPGDAPLPAGAFDVEVRATPLTSFKRGSPETRFGALEWLGGLELSSPVRHFGAFSGIATADKGRDLLLLTDNGFWLAARLESGPDGKPLAVGSARMAVMRDSDGRPLLGKDDADAESLAIRPAEGGFEALVGFEERHRVLRFRATGPFPGGVLGTRGERFAALWNEQKPMRWSKGLESLAIVPPGLMGDAVAVGLSEAPPRGERLGYGYIFRPRGFDRFRFVLRDDYDPTDATFTPEGDLLVLERRFTIASGVGARIRRVRAGTIAPGAVVDAEVIFEADLSDQIDNMEGIALDVAEDGRRILTLVSDDNRSILQRTLLLRFRLRDD
ncbi:esterase-like activity of phytase family protein [Prosthecomicrobium sp. N25]|uniref:esterase-like activity of phytase family protein n=1 Tax=Prosthecomicrobium sp. N25 TaxID=3129254 RepID=UPI003077E0C6